MSNNGLQPDYWFVLLHVCYCYVSLTFLNEIIIIIIIIIIITIIIITTIMLIIIINIMDDVSLHSLTKFPPFFDWYENA